MEIFLILLLLLLVTKIGADVAVRLGQPALVGELLGGVAIGVAATLLPQTVGFVTDVNSDKTFDAILDLAVFFLMLVAGLEMRPKDLAGVSGRATPVAIAGMLLPLVLGIGLGWWLLPESEWLFAQSLFLGVALAITAVPVAVKVLIDLDQLQTETGQIVVAAAVIDDVLSLVLLAVLTAILSGSQELSAATLFTISGKVLLFFAISLLVAKYIMPVIGKILGGLAIGYASFTTVVILGLALSMFAEFLHMHFLIGAFTAGLMCSRRVIGEDSFDAVRDEIEALTLGFFAPVFFASIGIHLSLSAALEVPLFVILLLGFATFGKLLGAGGAALVAGLDRRQALAVGSAMNARGAVEIIIADIALRAGLFQHPEPVPPIIENMFSAVVIMAIVTTLIAPLMLRALLARQS